jgi:hypothetical protein
MSFSVDTLLLFLIASELAFIYIKIAGDKE